jgi:hypothetical protein
MKPAMNATLTLPSAKPFPIPGDASAWWAFGSSALGGLVLLRLRAPQRLAGGLWLILGLGCLFLASDWISSLSGKSLRGEVPKAAGLSIPGLLLCGAALSGLLVFGCLLPPEDTRFWLTALACGASLTGIMFLLRLELPPHDSRLLALSSLLCTSPALYLAFLAIGGPQAQAWFFWLAPALYFPVNAVFAWTWLQGLYESKAHLTLLAAPILFLVLAALSRGADLVALVFCAYLAYLLLRLLGRYRLGAERLPEFADIRRLGREQLVWNAVVALAWFFSGVAQ